MKNRVSVNKSEPQSIKDIGLIVPVIRASYVPLHTAICDPNETHGLGGWDINPQRLNNSTDTSASLPVS